MDALKESIEEIFENAMNVKNISAKNSCAINEIVQESESTA